MALRIVRLGSEREPNEGLRIGTVRWPPRGVRKSEYASRDFFDVWLPALAPSAETIKLAKGADSERDWRRFEKRYSSEMSAPEARTLLTLLAALSRKTDLSVGCYCVDESRCHRSVLRDLLKRHGAQMA